MPSAVWATSTFDVLVVGGGITGTGVALDAASRGLRTALVDKGDFASGTSSKSSKLVHGGIRYLQQKEVGLVYEALAERQILRKTAPHLVRVLPFLLPVFTKDGLLPRRIARLLGAHDVGVRPHRRPAHRQAAQAREQGRGVALHADAAGRQHRRVVHLLRRPGRRRAAHAHGREDRGRVRRRGRRTTRRSSGSRRTRPARSAARGCASTATEIEVRARTVVERDRRVVGRGPRARRPHAHHDDPSRQGHPHHGAVVARAQRDRGRDPGTEGSAFGVRRAVGRRRRTAPVHLHRHHRHRLRRPDRRPADHRRRRRVPPARDQRRVDDEDHRGRHPRHVGRPAPARRRGQERTHRRPLPPPLGAHVAGRRRHRHRRQAHDVPAHGRRRGRRGRQGARARRSRSRTKQIALHGADGLGRGRHPEEPGRALRLRRPRGRRARDAPIPSSRDR